MADICDAKKQLESFNNDMPETAAIVGDPNKVYANSVTVCDVTNHDIAQYCATASYSDKYELIRMLLKDPEVMFIINDIKGRK